MNKLGSEFIEDFEEEDRGIFGISYRHILLFLSIISTIVLIFVVEIIFKLPRIIIMMYILTITIPGVFFGLSAEKTLKIKDRMHYLFLIKRRVYQTEIKSKEKGEN